MENLRRAACDGQEPMLTFHSNSTTTITKASSVMIKMRSRRDAPELPV